MTIPQNVKDAVERGDRFFSPDESAAMSNGDWLTIRAELHRLSEIDDSVEPLVIRLGDVTAELERANALLRDIAGCQWFNREAPATVELIDAHLQGAGDEA